MSDCADFDTLWHGYKVKITEYVTRRVGPDIAEDIVHDVYISAWKALDKGTEVDHISGWIFRIAHNAIIDYYRQRNIRQTVDLEAITEVADAHVTHDEAEKTLDKEQLYRAIERLTDEQALVVIRCIQGYEYSEIAAELGKDYEAVKAQYYRGKNTLRTLLTNAPVANTAAVLAPKRRKAKAKSMRVTSTMLVRNLLIEHGPLSAADVARLLDKQRTNMCKIFAKNTKVFVSVAHRQGARGKIGKAWGVRGVHDKEAA